MEEKNQQAVQALLSGINELLKEVERNSTKIYNGVVIRQNGSEWDVQYNGKVHTIPLYGTNTPKVGRVVKVFIPQGNANLTFFI